MCGDACGMEVGKWMGAWFGNRSAGLFGVYESDGGEEIG